MDIEYLRNIYQLFHTLQYFYVYIIFSCVWCKEIQYVLVQKICQRQQKKYIFDFL